MSSSPFISSPVHAPFTTPISPTAVASAPSLAVVSFSFSSTPNHRRVVTPVEKLTRVAGQRIRNYDLSRWRDYLPTYLPLSSTLVIPRPVLVAYVCGLAAALVSHRIAMQCLKIFSGKSITKADNARLFKRWYPFSRKYTDIWEKENAVRDDISRIANRKNAGWETWPLHNIYLRNLP